MKTTFYVRFLYIIFLPNELFVCIRKLKYMTPWNNISDKNIAFGSTGLTRLYQITKCKSARRQTRAIYIWALNMGRKPPNMRLRGHIRNTMTCADLAVSCGWTDLSHTCLHIDHEILEIRRHNCVALARRSAYLMLVIFFWVCLMHGLLGGLKETKMFFHRPLVKLSIVGSLRDREVASSASDLQVA